MGKGSLLPRIRSGQLLASQRIGEQRSSSSVHVGLALGCLKGDLVARRDLLEVCLSFFLACLEAILAVHCT